MTEQTGIIAEQQDYYRARAAEYDEWFERTGRYDHGPELNDRWRHEADEVRAALRDSGIDGDVLEFAGGTGIWTLELARRVASVTVVDASAEMMAINRQKLADVGLAGNVTYQQADIFAWRPRRRYDAVFFGFWISHVPDERLAEFIATVRAALKAGGRVFYIDSKRESSGTAADQPLSEPENPVMTRRLNDGRTWRIYKLFRTPTEMERAFRAGGIDLTVRETATYFQYGVGTVGEAPE
jgi:demethylmenaquinone methyltransferase/2-methoxy-6-polyprenyl-1,4-benzoquinol methylase